MKSPPPFRSVRSQRTVLQHDHPSILLILYTCDHFIPLEFPKPTRVFYWTDKETEALQRKGPIRGSLVGDMKEI